MAKNKTYRLAAQKIEEAQRSGATMLDLSGDWKVEGQDGLSELPESLGRLTQLQDLNLSYNRLEALPEWLGRLTQLQDLNLSYNRLEALSEWLGRLTQLQDLNLSNNRLEALPEWLGRLTQLQDLNLSNNRLEALPESLGRLTQLQTLEVYTNKLTTLPESLGDLANLRSLKLPFNKLKTVPKSLGNLKKLEVLHLAFGSPGIPFYRFPDWIQSLRRLKILYIDGCELSELPEWIGELSALTHLRLVGNRITDLPPSVNSLGSLSELSLKDNPLNPELAAAHEEGFDAIKRYLRAKAGQQLVLNEAKLILVGEGEVGKSCLLGALRGDPWEEGRPTTHGIEIKPVKVTDPATDAEITLNGWDFGGQRVYRPTHQLFFSAPAVYLVVWKPREGPQQGFVKEWIKLVKHREPDAKILVIATHGGPKERQPDIDRQEIWDLFGRDTVVDFFTVDSRPDANGNRPTISILKDAIARVASSLPEVGRTVPKHWQEAREALRRTNEAYLPLDRVFAVCREHKIEEEDARFLLRICRRVGDLIHYEHDPVLSEVVVLKPDWLATAISFVLDDKETREVSHGLIEFERLGMLWQDTERPAENRYPARLHPIFLRLMERFDLSYRIAERNRTDAASASLIAQLVPDVRDEAGLARVWPVGLSPGDEQQVQICRIVETTNHQSATAEGLFFQLIVRLHKYSLGRENFCDSVHWQRGLVLEDDTGARAFLEHVGNDVRITVRSPYPARFLAALTYEAKWLVEDFWKGMLCEITVPCLVPKANDEPCKGLFEVSKLLENLKRGRPEVPCPICNEWQIVERLLGNAPAARPNPLGELLANFTEVTQALEVMRGELRVNQTQLIGRFDNLDVGNRELVSKVEAAYFSLMRALLDEAKEGPRLFGFEPVDPGFLDRPKWLSAKFKLTLWCEHARLPLWKLAGDPKKGVYTIDLPREWLVKASPFLKVLSSTLGLVLPVASAGLKLDMPKADYEAISRQLEFGKAASESLLKGGDQVGEWLAKDDDGTMGTGAAIRADGAVLRQLHVWLKEKDPTFGGLLRVMNRRQEFLWVHPTFEGEY